MVEGGHGGCCTPASDRGPITIGPAITGSSTGEHRIEQISLPGGAFHMGDAHGDGSPYDGETPVHEVRLGPFTIDATPVTNEDFRRFTEDSGYETEAELFGFSAVFHLALSAPERDVVGQPSQTPWWLGVTGADWRHPRGRESDLEGLGDHPVVHVTWNDAKAYCAWAGRRLPTEAEWEYASRGGLESQRYPWGDEVPSDGWPCNIWQGTFPQENTLDDGYLTTAPVRSFAPNGFGLWQTVGNVWEWVEDWFSPTYYGESPGTDPRGPREGVQKVMRGGSFLCHDSYCNRYRNAARTSNTPDSSMANTGFRTVAASPRSRGSSND